MTLSGCGWSSSEAVNKHLNVLHVCTAFNKSSYYFVRTKIPFLEQLQLDEKSNCIWMTIVFLGRSSSVFVGLELSAVISCCIQKHHLRPSNKNYFLSIKTTSISQNSRSKW